MANHVILKTYLKLHFKCVFKKETVSWGTCTLGLVTIIIIIIIILNFVTNWCKIVCVCVCVCACLRVCVYLVRGNDVIILEQVMQCALGPLLLHGLTLVPAWISNCFHYKVWDEITYPFLNFNVTMDKKFHPTLYRACDYLSMLGLKLNHVSKRGPWWEYFFLNEMFVLGVVSFILVVFFILAVYTIIGIPFRLSLKLLMWSSNLGVSLHEMCDEIDFHCLGRDFGRISFLALTHLFLFLLWKQSDRIQLHCVVCEIFNAISRLQTAVLVRNISFWSCSAIN